MQPPPNAPAFPLRKGFIVAYIDSRYFSHLSLQFKLEGFGKQSLAFIYFQIAFRPSDFTSKDHFSPKTIWRIGNNYNLPPPFWHA